MSRYPVFNPKEDGEHLHAEEADAPEEEDDNEDIDTAVDYCKRVNSGVNNMNFIIENIDQGYRHLVQQIREDNMTDRRGKKLKHYKINYESDRCYMSLKKYEGHTLIMYNSTRLLIPTNARRRIANELHKAHSGLTKIMKTATQLYYWPNMRMLLESAYKSAQPVKKTDLHKLE